MGTWRTVLLMTQLLKKSSALYGTWTFITMFTGARHWDLSWTRWIKSI